MSYYRPETSSSHKFRKEEMSSETSSEDGFDVEQVDDPSFFQLYLPQRNSVNLRIPPPFLKNFKRSVPESISLKNSSGRVWPAKLAYIDNDLHITHGWDRYVKDHELETGDFVMFRYQQNSKFLVFAYGFDGTLKPEPRKKKRSKNLIDDQVFSEAGNLMFYKIFKTKFNNYVGVPIHIIDACSITVPQTVKLTNDEGRGFEIQVRKATDRFILGYAGLSRFWQKNGVEEGDKLKFEVIRDDVNTIKQIVVTNITPSKAVLGRGY